MKLLKWKLLALLKNTMAQHPGYIHNGGINIIIDMREANKAILSTNSPTPRAEDMQAFSAAKLFQ